MLWKKLIAQLDIKQSNSMVEMANYVLKYSFLFHQYYETLAELLLVLPDILHHYNNVPLGCIGLTPNKVLDGKIPDKKLFANEINATERVRLSANQKIVCDNTCGYFLSQ